MKIIAIESSCDDTSVSIVENGTVLSNLVSSQEIHNFYGGIVPELASRKHIEIISYLTKRSLNKANLNLSQIDGIGVTNAPGLAGSLLVGINFAKGLSLATGKPVIPINHIEGHIFSGHIENPNLSFPTISLVVSGGHTSIFFVESFSKYEAVGSTIDDAAGEAFDKIAKMLGLGYPGGPIVDKLAKDGNKNTYDFPRSMLNKPDFNFSFSGLKTSVRYFIEKNFNRNVPEEKLPDICASVQEAIVEVLAKKSIKAAKNYNCSSIIVGGGVSANSRLRAYFKEIAKENINVVFPDMEYCIDNAAMIGFVAEKKFLTLKNKDLKLDFTANPKALRA
jgi:N6-L-threonylcarbamoyladenine synthase